MQDATPAGNGATPADQAAQVLPLFYSQPEILRRDVHQNLALKGAADFSFAQGANAIPVTLREFPVAGFHYPIIFVVGRELTTPVAVTGVEQGSNLFVDPDGQWDKAAYVPAYVRRYPFVFVRDREQDRFALCVDRASNRLTEGEDGQKLFEGEEMSQLTKQALDFCTAYQQEAQQTERFVQMIVDMGLIVQKSMTLTLMNGSKIAINNVGIIDEEKLGNLSDEQFLELRKTGALGPIYCQLMSQRCWQNLILRKG